MLGPARTRKRFRGLGAATEPATPGPRLKQLYALDCRKVATGLRIPMRTIRTGRDAAAVFNDFSAAADQESLMVLYLDGRHRPIAFAEVAKGAVNVVQVSPRDVLKSGLATGATAFIMAHNHPTGDPTPSEDDANLTDRMRAAGDLVGLDMMDHIVVGEDGYYSFQAASLIRASRGWRQVETKAASGFGGAGALLLFFGAGFAAIGALAARRA